MTTDLPSGEALQWAWLRFELLAALVYGQALKVACTCYAVDRATVAPLRFPRCLWAGAEKYRTVGSWMLVLGMFFVVPQDVFQRLLTYQVDGIPWGLATVSLLGFVADDLFLIIPLLVSQTLRKLTERLGVPTNGRFKSSDIERDHEQQTGVHTRVSQFRQPDDDAGAAPTHYGRSLG